MENFKIEKDVPVPGTYHHRAKYPFPEMEVGDSFLVPYGGKPKRVVMNNVRSAGSYYGKRHGIRFVFRTEEGGVRTWRVE
jgi:hypothetical protein